MVSRGKLNQLRRLPPVPMLGWRFTPEANNAGGGYSGRAILVDFNSRAHTIAFASFYFLHVGHWRLHRLVSRMTSIHLRSAWLCARVGASEELGALSRTNLCRLCGWISGRIEAGEEICSHCGNVSVCELCVYMVGGRPRCLMCPLVPGDHRLPPERLALARLWEHCCDLTDAWFSYGDFHLRKRTLRSAFWFWKNAVNRSNREEDAARCVSP